MEICNHKNLVYSDGMFNSAEAPYDSGDFWWNVDCDDCGELIAEGDGYSQPDWVKKLSK